MGCTVSIFESIKMLALRSSQNRNCQVALCIGAALVGYRFLGGSYNLLTGDQNGYRLFNKEHYQEAAVQFSDPLWRGTALFRAGKFQEAADLFAGYDSIEAAFNHGNSLVMLGSYELAVERYDRALELRPGWDDAIINREIAVGRAKQLDQKGGEGTGGKLGADEIVFTQGKSPAGAGEEDVSGEREMNDVEFRAVWLRNVQTKPADFLRSKFAYQQSMAGLTAGKEVGAGESK